MAAPSTRVLTLFDPDDKHEWCETQFDNQTFIRCTTSQSCYDHIRIHVAHPELDVHLFFPNTQVEVVNNWSPEHLGTIKYIHCPDQKSIDSTKKIHGKRYAHKVFTVDTLDFEIRHVQVSLWYSLGKREPVESDQRDRLISKATQELDCLHHSLKHMMSDQTSEQPLERH